MPFVVEYQEQGTPSTRARHALPLRIIYNAPMAEVALTLSVVPGTYAVCRLEKRAAVPRWALRGGFFSVTRTADELSIVCEQGLAPLGVLCEMDWACLKVHGPLPFEATGVLTSLAAPMAEAGISIFALSTYDTDYLMVKTAGLEMAIDTLTRAGHTVAYADAE